MLLLAPCRPATPARLSGGVWGRASPPGCWLKRRSPAPAPVPASSGKTTRHRLNRGGDRRLNRVLTTVVLVHMRRDQATRDYVARRKAEGRTTKEIMRALKRYITRQIFRTLAQAHPAPAT